MPAEDRPYTCWGLFKACQAGEYDEIHEKLRVVEMLIEAGKSHQEKFDDLVDGMS